MPDISMCENTACLLREVCYRFMAEPSEYQSYSKFEPDENGKCEYFYPLKTTK